MEKNIRAIDLSQMTSSAQSWLIYNDFRNANSKGIWSLNFFHISREEHFFIYKWCPTSQNIGNVLELVKKKTAPIKIMPLNLPPQID